MGNRRLRVAARLAIGVVFFAGGCVLAGPAAAGPRPVQWDDGSSGDACRVADPGCYARSSFESATGNFEVDLGFDRTIGAGEAVSRRVLLYDTGLTVAAAGHRPAAATLSDAVGAFTARGAASYESGSITVAVYTASVANGRLWTGSSNRRDIVNTDEAGPPSRFTITTGGGLFGDGVDPDGRLYVAVEITGSFRWHNALSGVPSPCLPLLPFDSPTCVTPPLPSTGADSIEARATISSVGLV